MLVQPLNNFSLDPIVKNKKEKLKQDCKNTPKNIHKIQNPLETSRAKPRSSDDSGDQEYN